jgi:hypothetical protein
MMIRYLYFLISAPLVYILLPILINNKGWRIGVILIHALLLTAFTLFVFNEPGWRWSEQVDFIRSFGTKNENSIAAYSFVKNNFLLIDNSFDKQLIPDPEGDEEANTNIIVTDRQKLADFLHFIYDHKDLVGFVVVDIGFIDSSKSDFLLYQALVDLYAEEKILISYSSAGENNKVFHFNGRIYGDVHEEVNEGIYVSHLIKRKEYFSLPYKMYGQLNGLRNASTFFGERLIRETDSAGRSAWVLNRFEPEFSIIDEEKLRSRSTRENSFSVRLGESEEKTTNYYKLGETITPTGSTDLLYNLQQRRELGQKNNFLLGAFASPSDDIHQTPYGALHGTTILLNVLYQLQQHKHYLSWTFVGILFISFCLISLLLVYIGVGIPLKINFVPRLFNKKLNSEKKEKKSKAKGLRLFSALWYYAREELHFLLLFILLFFVNRFSNHLVNGFSLLVYLGIVASLLKHFGNRYRHSHIVS